MILLSRGAVLAIMLRLLWVNRHTTDEQSWQAAAKSWSRYNRCFPTFPLKCHQSLFPGTSHYAIRWAQWPSRPDKTKKKNSERAPPTKVRRQGGMLCGAKYEIKEMLPLVWASGARVAFLCSTMSLENEVGRETNFLTARGGGSRNTMRAL